MGEWSSKKRDVVMFKTNLGGEFDLNFALPHEAAICSSCDPFSSVHRVNLGGLTLVGLHFCPLVLSKNRRFSGLVAVHPI